MTSDQHEDATHLRETMRWGYWPYCPVKRNINEECQVGSCYDGENGQRIVYLINLFEVIKTGIIPKDTQSITYDNSVKMVLDGWMVD